jgi:PAS domain S-box-containing protein
LKLPEQAAATANFEELKRYVRFGPEDEQLLADLSIEARPHFDTIAALFYERIREHEEAHAVFQSEEQIQRLRASLVRWMERVLTGPYDAAYADKSAQIGHTHVRVGLPQRFMFGAMSLIRMRLHEIAERTMGERAPAACRALSRILDVELALMNQTYLDELVARASAMERDKDRRDFAALDPGQRPFARAVQLANAVIVGLDRERRIAVFNPEAERVSGRRASEVSGMAFGELLTEEDRARFDALLTELEGEDGGVSFVLELRNRSGRIRQLAGSLKGAPDDPDVAFILSARDITDERVLAEQLRRSESLASIGTLAAGLAHEIRNPLNGAQLHLTFLRRALRGVDNPDLAEAAQVVAEEIQRLSALVSEFLDFARPTELRRERVSIPDICRKAAAMVTTEAMKPRVEMPTSELSADVDPGKVEQVLLNLLHNALEAIQDGAGSEVVLRAYREPRHAVIEVSDDGPGLPSPTAPIFDAFYSTKPGGTGLGLAIVHRIVTLHDGVIGVDSKPGSTVFRVRLPLEHARSVSDRSQRGP